MFSINKNADIYGYCKSLIIISMRALLLIRIEDIQAKRVEELNRKPLEK